MLNRKRHDEIAALREAARVEIEAQSPVFGLGGAGVIASPLLPESGVERGGDENGVGRWPFILGIDVLGDSSARLVVRGEELDYGS